MQQYYSRELLKLWEEFTAMEQSKELEAVTHPLDLDGNN